MGDIAFPAFSLAKVERKAPQMIAAELAEKLTAKPLRRLSQRDLTLTFFLDKSAISAQVLQAVITEKNTMLIKLLANKKMLLSICLVPISLNHSLLVTCAQLLSEIACHISSKNRLSNSQGQPFGRLGKQFGMLIVAYKNGATKKL